MTLPNLITAYQKQQTVAQLRKVYSDISNAIRLAEAENGPSSQWKYPNNQDPECSNSSKCVVEFIKTYHLPYFKGGKSITVYDLPSNYSMVEYSSSHNRLAANYLLLNNGVLLGYFINMGNDSSGYFWWFADINGYKGPNKMGRDQFVFEPTGYADSRFRTKFWSGGTYGMNLTVEDLMNNGRYACNANNTDVYRNFNCGRVIEISGWKIPDNYPW